MAETTEKASVVTAKKRPLIRMAGRPMSTAMAPAVTLPSTSAIGNGSPQREVAAPPTTAPTATKPKWPRLIWPPHPVRITSETPMMP